MVWKTIWGVFPRAGACTLIARAFTKEERMGCGSSELLARRVGRRAAGRTQRRMQMEGSLAIALAALYAFRAHVSRQLIALHVGSGALAQVCAVGAQRAVAVEGALSRAVYLLVSASTYGIYRACARLAEKSRRP